jgi:SAM-dependent methyltransferase
MGQEQFDLAVDSYEAWFIKNQLIFQSEVAAIQQILPNRGKGVEIGVGTGLFAAALGIKDGIDPSEEMRHKAIERGINACEGVAEKLPIPTGAYDFALMVTVDCFLRDVLQAFKETWRILTEEGIFIIAFIDRETSLGHLYEQKKQTSVSYEHANFHSAREIKQYLALTGFVVVEERQTIFSLENRMQEVRLGTGEGVFGVFKAKKAEKLRAAMLEE